MPSLVKIGPVVLEKKIFESRPYIFNMLLLSTLENRNGPSFEQTWIPLLKNLTEMIPVVLEEKIKLWNFFNMSTTISQQKQWTNFDQKSSLVPLAHQHYLIYLLLSSFTFIKQFTWQREQEANRPHCSPEKLLLDNQ